MPNPCAEAIEGLRALDFWGKAGCDDLEEAGLVESREDVSWLGVLERPEPGIGAGDDCWYRREGSSTGVFDLCDWYCEEACCPKRSSMGVFGK